MKSVSSEAWLLLWRCDMDDLLLRRRLMMTEGEAPYLEIEPDLIWIYDWEAQNDVLSNTDWNVQ